jgi:hypothetical protein
MLSQIQRDLVNFEFSREPLITQMSGAPSGFDAIRNVSDGHILGVFKSNQYVCNHLMAVDKVESAFNEMGLNPEVTEFELMKNGAQLYVHYRLPDSLAIDLGDNIPGVSGSDVLIPEVILRNGYEGRTIFGLEFGLFRLVCSNGARTLVLGDRASARQYIGDVDISVIVAGVREFCEVLLLNLKNRITEMVMNTAPTLQSEVREWVCSNFSNKLISVWDQQMEYAEEDAGEKGLSEWCLYNGCTFIVNHMMNSYSRRRGMEIQLAKQFGLSVRSNNQINVEDGFNQPE